MDVDASRLIAIAGIKGKSEVTKDGQREAWRLVFVTKLWSYRSLGWGWLLEGPHFCSERGTIVEAEILEVLLLHQE